MENNYTEEDLMLLVSMLKTSNPICGFFNSMRSFIESYPSPMIALIKFLEQHFLVFAAEEFLDLPLEDMPLYINHHKRLRATIASWRMKIGK